MTIDVLSGLLRAGLLHDLEDDDQRRNRVQAAAVRVGEWLIADGRPALPAAFLRSLDESTTGDANPAVSYADKRLLDEWPSYRNVFPEMPAELLRAIVLQAIANAVASVPELEIVVWYLFRTARDLEVSVGRWDAVLGEMCSQINESVTTRLDAQWMPSPDGTKLRMPSIKESDQVSDHHEELKSLARDLGVELRRQLDAQRSLSEAARLREALMWWSLSGYSDHLQCHYADIDNPADRAVAAAVDVRAIVPEAAPVAVEHLLAKVVASDHAKATPITFDDVASAWQRVEPPFRPSAELGAKAAGLVVSALSGSDKAMSALAVPEALAPSSVVALIYRDLQVLRLLSGSVATSGKSAAS